MASKKSADGTGDVRTIDMPGVGQVYTGTGKPWSDAAIGTNVNHNSRQSGGKTAIPGGQTVGKEACRYTKNPNDY